MKRIIAFLLVTLSLTLQLQANDEITNRDKGTSMVGFDVVATSETAPESILIYLENAIDQVLSHEGLRYRSGDCVLEISVNELERNMVATTPPRTQLRLEIVVRAVDKSKGIVYNTVTLPATGMDVTEEKAYMTAIRMVNFRTRNFFSFLIESKERILKAYPNTYVPEGTPLPPPPPLPSAQRRKEAQEAEMPDLPPVEVIPGVKLANGVYVEYMGKENKSATTDILLRITNYNDKDEVIDFGYNAQVVVDSQGKNVTNAGKCYDDGSSLGRFTLIKDVPVTIRFNYRGHVNPQVLYFHEATRDFKIRIPCR